MGNNRVGMASILNKDIKINVSAILDSKVFSFRRDRSILVADIVLGKKQSDFDANNAVEDTNFLRIRRGFICYRYGSLVPSISKPRYAYLGSNLSFDEDSIISLLRTLTVQDGENTSERVFDFDDSGTDSLFTDKFNVRVAPEQATALTMATEKYLDRVSWDAVSNDLVAFSKLPEGKEVELLSGTLAENTSIRVSVCNDSVFEGVFSKSNLIFFVDTSCPVGVVSYSLTLPEDLFLENGINLSALQMAVEMSLSPCCELSEGRELA